MAIAFHLKFILIASLCVFAQESPHRLMCQEDDYLDKCFKTIPPLMKGNITYGIPSTEKEVTVLCGAFEKGIKCVDNYTSSCASDPVKKVVEENVAGARHTFASLCNDTVFKSEYIEHSSCYRSVSTEWESCSRSFLAEAKTLNPFTPQGRKDICCAKEAFYRCVYSFGVMRCRENAALFLRRVAQTLLDVHVSSVDCFPKEEFKVNCGSVPVSIVSKSHTLMLLFVSVIATLFGNAY